MTRGTESRRPVGLSGRELNANNLDLQISTDDGLHDNQALSYVGTHAYLSLTSRSGGIDTRLVVVPSMPQGLFVWNCPSKPA